MDERAKSGVKKILCTHVASEPCRTGNDSGTQYASVIFAHDKDQRGTAEKVKDKVQKLVSSGAITAFAGKEVCTVRFSDTPGMIRLQVQTPQTTTKNKSRNLLRRSLQRL